MPFDEPLFIIEMQPVEERLAELLHRLERAHPLSGDSAELLAHPLANRLQGLKAGGPPRRMDADPFERAMVHADEDRDGPVLHRHRAHRIRAPPLIRTFGRDHAVVDPWSHDARRPAGGQEIGLPHQPQDAGLRGVNPLCLQPCPDFVVPLSEKRRGGEHLPDVSREHLIRVRGLRPSFGRRKRWSCDTALLVIERCPTQPPFLTDPDHAIRAMCGRRRSVAHRVDLRTPKGAPPRNRSTASREGV